MANDIALIIGANPINNGTVIVTTSVKGVYSSNEDHVSNLPSIAQIQDKYQYRFDDPSYYYGTGLIDGGDVWNMWDKKWKLKLDIELVSSGLH